MTATKKDPVLVVLQLTGGNDYMNTVIPHADPLYREKRPVVGVADDRIIKLNDRIGLHPEVGPLKRFWDSGDMAIIHGVGYANSPRSHFRSMDIWHTCEPDSIGTEGWLGQVIKELDPNNEGQGVTGVNFGRGLPRALAKEGVPVASVGNLETYGLLTGIEGEDQRAEALDLFSKIYAPTVGGGFVSDYLRSTGTYARIGADILATATPKYTSNVEYSSSAVGQYMKNIAQTHLADLGTRVLFTTSPYNGFDTYANQAQLHSGLWTDVSANVDTFVTDLREHNAGDNVVLFMFSEFGRRVGDNGSGTDHGAGSVAFALGENVKGGIYGVYPSLEPSQQEEGGNLKSSMDFRQVYATILEDWMGLDSNPINRGVFEKVPFL